MAYSKMLRPILSVYLALNLMAYVYMATYVMYRKATLDREGVHLFSNCMVSWRNLCNLYSAICTMVS